MGGKSLIYIFAPGMSNLRPLVAKESHSSGLGKGIQGFGELRCQLRTGEAIPSSPKEVCKNMVLTVRVSG